eukprot:2853182-Rhodomonas_salina.3
MSGANLGLQSGEFYEPVSAGGMYGPVGKKGPPPCLAGSAAWRCAALTQRLPPELEPHCTSQDNEAVLWEASCEAVGDFPLPAK